MSSHDDGAHGAVAWAMSPTTVIDPASERRVSIRSCMGDRSWTSSTTMWPYLRSGSSAPPLRGPSRWRASSISAASAGVQATSSNEDDRGRRRRACSSGVRIPRAAAAISGGAP